jgi:hypothetical protein
MAACQYHIGKRTKKEEKVGTPLVGLVGTSEQTLNTSTGACRTICHILYAVTQRERPGTALAHPRLVP